MNAGAVEIPPSLIKKRWTKSAREGVICCIPGFKNAAARDADGATMHGLLHAAAMELVGMGTTSRQAFELAVDYVSHAKKALSEMTVIDPSQCNVPVQSAAESSIEASQFDPALAAPPRVRSRGRPKELRFKSPIESPGSSRRQAKPVPDKCKMDDQRTRRTTRFLKTGVLITEHCDTCGSTQHVTGDCMVEMDEGPTSATRRRCKMCGETGHNRSTCGRKSTYTPKYCG